MLYSNGFVSTTLNRVAVRAPAVNNPIQTVTSLIYYLKYWSIYTCIDCRCHDSGGAKVNAWYEHILGPKSANDADNPIAVSHKRLIVPILQW
jgi:hypothetical protein